MELIRLVVPLPSWRFRIPEAKSQGKAEIGSFS
jgi:hypothetical protein